MIDLLTYIEAIAESYAIAEPGFKENISAFIISNNWWGEKPEVKDKRIYVSDAFAERCGPYLDQYCECYYMDYKDKVNILGSSMSAVMPKTAGLLLKYAKACAVMDSVMYRLIDFLWLKLPGEIDESTDREIGTLMDDAYEILPKTYGDVVADFVNWVHTHTKTVYKNIYIMEQYTSHEATNTAYSPEKYLEILYHLFNEEYVEKNDMYASAAASKNYVDAWLFLSLHFLCALRNSDLMLLPHPQLRSEPQAILEMIENNTFTDEEARLTLYSILWNLEATSPVPNKTKQHAGVAPIKLFVPQSVEVHIGKLFAVAEAHYRLKNYTEAKPLIRVITSYEQISSYMGNEIGDLFLDANFSTRAANKSYLQMIYLLTDEILGVNDEFNVKGYMLAALARSHKGSYGEFAKTTSIYLKDAKMSGYTPDFVAKEMFERGVLSAIPSMLLKMITDGEYNKLSVGNQTKLVQALNLSPSDIEKSVGIMQLSIKHAVAVADAAYKGLTREQILTVLHKLGNGDAASKCDGCLCLMTAMGLSCRHPEITNCPNCEYEISTKSTMFVMARECKRLMALYNSTERDIEKARYSALAQNVVIPTMEEMLAVMEEHYGREAVESLERIILEAL